MKMEKIVLPLALLVLLAGGCGAKEKTVSKSVQESKAGEKMSQENKTQKTTLVIYLNAFKNFFLFLAVFDCF